MAHNRLGEQTSPYLLQHRDNPVHWQPWDDEALSLAERENKPILLSIGYSACHWCHVMAHESFEDEETAKLMNRHFVNIKVDREERPDLDAAYQTALDKMGHRRGWPLTMFLTPKGEPFAGGTYFPPTARHDLPAFRDVLQSAAKTYTTNPEQAVKDAANRVAAVDTQPRRRSGHEISLELMNYVASRLLDNVDVVYGGFGMDAKFPQTMLLEVMWRTYVRNGHSTLRDAVVRSLEYMCSGGIYDHLGGGYARYTVDDRWLVPHFEKMLYDNALILSLLTLVWRERRSILFARRIEETVDWVLQEMKAPDGGFAASLAADSAGYGHTDGGEGAFYVWREGEIDAILGDDDSPLFKSFYGVSAEGNWEGKTILNRLDRPMGEDASVEDRLGELRAKLLTARGQRPRPETDDKVLADWNGLIIVALADAGAAFERPEWVEAALDAYTFVVERMSTGDRLHHSYRDGRYTPIAILDDYANMAHAAIRLYELTGNADCLEQARTWVAITDQHYWDNDDGAYFFTAEDDKSIITRTKGARETSVPSGNGVMVGVLARLYVLTSDDAYRQRAEATVAAFSAEVPSHYLAMGTLINNSELLREPVQIVILGESENDDTRRLLRAVYETSLPNQIVLRVSPDAVLSPAHPAAGKVQIANKATAYVCRGATCGLPITTPDDLKATLEPKSLDR